MRTTFSWPGWPTRPASAADVAWGSESQGWRRPPAKRPQIVWYQEHKGRSTWRVLCQLGKVGWPNSVERASGLRMAAPQRNTPPIAFCDKGLVGSKSQSLAKLADASRRLPNGKPEATVLARFAIRRRLRRNVNGKYRPRSDPIFVMKSRKRCSPSGLGHRPKRIDMPEIGALLGNGGLRQARDGCRPEQEPAASRCSFRQPLTELLDVVFPIGCRAHRCE